MLDVDIDGIAGRITFTEEGDRLSSFSIIAYNRGDDFFEVGVVGDDEITPLSEMIDAGLVFGGGGTSTIPVEFVGNDPKPSSAFNMKSFAIIICSGAVTSLFIALCWSKFREYTNKEYKAGKKRESLMFVRKIALNLLDFGSDLACFALNIQFCVSHKLAILIAFGTGTLASLVDLGVCIYFLLRMSHAGREYIMDDLHIEFKALLKKAVMEKWESKRRTRLSKKKMVNKANSNTNDNRVAPEEVIPEEVATCSSSSATKEEAPARLNIATGNAPSLILLLTSDLRLVRSLTSGQRPFLARKRPH